MSRASLLSFSLLCGLACGSRATGTSASGESSEATTSSDASASTSDDATETVAVSSGSEADAGGDGDMGTDGSGETGASSCGNDVCGDDEYCDWEMNLCGLRDWEGGACRARPEGCDANYDPVCGCDAEVYSNECVANSAGVDVSDAGGCQAPAGYFACGTGFCILGASYCLWSVSDVVGQPNAWSCQPLPDGCPGEGDCNCVANEPCGSLCEMTEDGGVLVTCPGG